MALSRDARLVARTRRGDPAAFEALHARHQPAILSFCRHLTGNREDAEDAVQHTFLAAYRKIVESDERIDLRPWLYAVARNRCISLLRARRESAAAEPDAAAAGLEGLAAEVERRQDLRDLVGDLARLPEEQRAALVLSQLDALSYREIGGVLGVDPAKVKALVFQARSSLASTREAREAPCSEIRQEIATARGAGTRRRLLRRHVGQCDGCREFEVAMQRQRHQLDVLLPAIPSVGLAQAVLGGALGREGAAAGAGAGGAAAATGGGLSSIVASLGLGGAAKLAVVATVVAGGGVSAAAAADLPERLGALPLIGGERGVALERGDAGVGDEDAAGRGLLGADREQGRDDRSGAGDPARGDEHAGGAAGDGDDAGGEEERVDGRGGAGEDEAGDPSPGGGAPGEGHGDGDGKRADGGLPPGLAKRGDDLPPGLAKREGDLPPGLAKRLGVPPGQSGKPSNPGRGNGGSPPGQAGGRQGNGGGNGQGNGNGGGGGQGNGNGGGGGQGNGNGGGGGQGNGSAGQGAGQGNGNGGAGNPGGQGGGGGTGAGGQGNANGGGGQANGGGGGQGNGGGSGQGNGSGGGQGNGSAGQGAGQGNGNGGAGNAGGQGSGGGTPK